MVKKPGLTLERHKELSRELQSMIRRLRDLEDELQEAYPLKISTFAKCTWKDLIQLRDVLQNKACIDHPHVKNVLSIYTPEGLHDDPKSD